MAWPSGLFLHDILIFCSTLLRSRFGGFNNFFSHKNYVDAPTAVEQRTLGYYDYYYFFVFWPRVRVRSLPRIRHSRATARRVSPYVISIVYVFASHPTRKYLNINSIFARSINRVLTYKLFRDTRGKKRKLFLQNVLFNYSF